MSDPVIYDWPSSVEPSKQLFHAGGQSVEGGFTSGAARVVIPEPGGMSWLEMEFGYQANADADPLVSWLLSKVANSNIFRVPIARSPQLVSMAALGIAGSTRIEGNGLPWENTQPWDTGENWRFEPIALVTAGSLEGALSIDFDMGALANGLCSGHVIGHRDVAYLVDDISYSGSIASVTLMSPLRNDVASGDIILFRPFGLFTAANPEAFRSLYEPADLVKLGTVQLMECIL